MNANLSRRGLIMGAAAGAAAAGLGACAPGTGPKPQATSSGSGGSTPSSLPTDLRGTKVRIMGQSNEILKTDIARAKQELGIDIQLIELDQTRLMAMYAAGDAPDAVRHTAVPNTPVIGSRHLALPLDQYIDASSVIKRDDIVPAMDAARWDGKKQGAGEYYSLANDYSQDWMLWYNKDLFDEVGAKAPSTTTPATLDELLDAARKLVKKSNNRTLRYGIFDGTPRLDFLEYVAMCNGGTLWRDNLESIDLSAPEVRSTVDFWKSVAKEGLGPNSVTNPNADGWDLPAYDAKRQSMMNFGFWAGAYLSKASQQVSAFAPALNCGPKRVSPPTALSGYYIPSKAKNPFGGWKFIEWWCAGARAKERIAQGGGLPMLKSLQAQIPKDGWHADVWKVQEAELPHMATMTLASPYGDPGTIGKLLVDNFGKLVQGSMTTDAYLKAAQDYANQSLKTAKAKQK